MAAAVDSALPALPVQPTPAERQRERVVLTIGLAEVCVLALLVAAALASTSLTLLGTLLRLAIMLAIQFTTIALLFGVHRRRFGHLAFGFGKLEQISNLLGCCGLIVGGAWVGARVFDVLFLGPSPVTPSGLGLAAVLNAIVLLVNTLGLIAMNRALSAEASAIFRGQLRAREAKFYAALATQATITVAALSRDPAIASLMDGVGALIVAWVMMSFGFRLGWGCILNLLDHDVPAPVAARIGEALRASGAQGSALRCRRSGRFVQIELALPPLPAEDAAGFRARATRIEAALRQALGDHSDVSIVLDLRRGRR